MKIDITSPEVAVADNFLFKELESSINTSSVSCCKDILKLSKLAKNVHFDNLLSF